MRGTSVILWGALTAAVAGASWADGGFFRYTTTTAATVKSGHQRAVIVYDEGRETVVLQTAYEGGEADFAWVIPTPTRASRANLVEGDPRLFTELYNLTEPTGTATWDDGWECGNGCGGGDSGGSDNTAPGGVNVWDQFTVGNKAVSILSADESGDLSGWLTENGYILPDGSGEVLQHYQAQGWYFVAVKLNAADGDGGGGGPAAELKPLEINFETDAPVFPMRISSVSSHPTHETSVLLYVIASHRIQSSNYLTQEVNTAGWSGTDFPAFYDGRFRRAVGTPAGFVVEYAGRSDGSRPWSAELRGMLPGLNPASQYWVTRIRTYLMKQDMNRDVELQYAASDREFNPSQTYVANAGVRTVRYAGTGLFLLGAVTSQLRRNRKRSWSRVCLFGLLAVLLL